MINLKEIDEAANLWNKTRHPKYKKEWYKLVKEFADGKNANYFNTSVRRHINTRKTGFCKTSRNT